MLLKFTPKGDNNIRIAHMRADDMASAAIVLT